MITDILQKKKISPELLFFLIVIVLIFTFSLLINNNHPLSDAAFYSLVTEEIVESGNFPLEINKLPSDNKGFPIIYPSVFFISQAVSLLTIGDLYPLKLISYISLVIFLYLLLRNVFKLDKSLSLIATFLISTNYRILYYFFVHQKHEFLLILFFVATVYFLLKNEGLDYKYLIPISFFCIFAIGIKQTSYIFVFLVCLYIIFNKRIIINKKLVFLVIVVLFSLLIFSEFFLRTGTLFYPNTLPEPLNNMENKISSLFGIEKVVPNEKFIVFLQKTLIQEVRVKNIWNNWFLVLFGERIYSNYIRTLLLPLLFLGFYFLIRFRPSFLILPSLVLIYSLVYWKLTIPEYFVFIPIFTVPAIIFLFRPFYNKFNKRSKIILVSILFILISLSASSNFSQLYKIKEENIKTTEIYKRELDEPGAILSSRTYELALYQQRKVYWFHIYGNWSLFEMLSDYNSEALKNYMLENNIKYIFIPKNIIYDSVFKRTWPGHISIELVNNLRKDNNFRIYTEDSDMLIFKLENK